MELRDLLSRLFSTPATALGDVLAVMWHNLLLHWWSLAILVAVFVVARWGLSQLAERLASQTSTLRMKGRRRRRLYAQHAMAMSVSTFSLWLVFILMVMGQLGIVISPQTMGVILGSLGLATALVTQGYVKDAIAAWNVLMQDIYGVGDYIDVGFGFAGTVVDINLHTTKLRGVDGTIYHLRNSEMPKIANRTQHSGKLVVDVELTRFDDEFVTSSDLDEWERVAVSALSDLREVLRDVRALSEDDGVDLDEADIEKVAAVVPVLVPNLTEDTMTDMRAITEVSNPRRLVRQALDKAPVGVTPLFRDIQMLGLVSSAGSSATIRVRVLLADPRSRSYAMSLMRRRLFDAFNPFQVSTGFTEVSEGEFIN